MHPTLSKIQEQLNSLIAQVRSAIPSEEPLNIAHNTWNLPGLAKSEFIEAAQSIIDLIGDQGQDEIGEEVERRIKDYVRRLAMSRSLLNA